MAAILELRSVSKAFPGVKALQSVAFRIERGHVHSIVGENGAGKSTLMHIIAGVHKPDEGELLLDGKSALFANPAASQAAGIAIVYQELNLAPNLTVAENIFLGVEPYEFGGLVKHDKVDRKTRAILQDLGILLEPTLLVEELSLGQRQLVEICKALVRNPRILILDEPTSSLTNQEAETLFRLIKELKNSGVTILYISHRLPEIFRISDTVTVLRDGKHIHTVPVAVTNEDEVVRLMVGRNLLESQRAPHIAKRGTAALEISGLSDDKKYHDISFRLHRGEILGLAGLMGAGRSELAHGIFGEHSPSRGKVLINGKLIKIRSPRDAIKNGVGLVPEDRKSQGLGLMHSVGNNLSLAALPKLARAGIIASHVERTMVAKFIDRLNVRAAGIDQAVGFLSGGNQQKVVLAKWLATSPKVLIVDEPTRGVDVGTKAEIYSLFRELAAEGLALLVISSDLPEIISISDRVLVMRNGTIVGELQRCQLTEENIMSLAALGKS